MSMTFQNVIYRRPDNKSSLAMDESSHQSVQNADTFDFTGITGDFKGIKIIENVCQIGDSDGINRLSVQPN